MNTLTSKEEKPTVAKEIERLLLHLRTLQPGSDDYRKTVDNISVLRQTEGIKTERSISMETIVNIGAQVALALLVLNYERTGVITSKAFGMFRGGRG